MNPIAHPPVDERREHGFTLAEVLVSIVIEAMIVAALGAAFIAILRGSTSVKQSLSASEDARIAAAYIVSDARNSSGPEVSLTDTTSCADPNPPVAGTPSPVVRFNWTTTAASGATSSDIVEYMLVSSSLVRRECQGGALVSDRAVATNVASVIVACSPTADCSGNPSSITVTITELPESTAVPYVYKLTGAFQKIIGGGPPLTPGPPSSVILLGAGTTCSGGTNTIDIRGSATMRVYGDAFINTKDGASCNAMYVAGSGTFQAGGTSIVTGGSCKSGTNGLPCPPTTPFSPAITDPYASLAAPPTTGLPSRTGCSGPGLYASGFSLGGGSTCTLASGIYVVKGGFDLGNGATLNTGAGGVLIYLMSGGFVVDGGASLTLTAMTSGTYAGIAFWQAAADTTTISFSNGGALIFNGAIYAPKAQLNISGNAQTPLATALVVQTVVLSNSGGITVGSPSVPGLSISAPASLAAWTVNRPSYSQALLPAGGDGNYIWSATGLPAGLAFDPSGGVISGKPTAVGSSTVTVTLDDQLGDDTVTKSYTLTVHAAPSISTASPLPVGELSAAYSATLAGAAGTTPYSWLATGLPAGLTISSTGVIAGTPAGTAGTSTVAVTLTDAAGATVSKNLSLTVNNAPNISTSTLPSGEKSLAYSATVAATSGTTPYSWSATGLPAGLSIASGTGVISGTPTASGTSTVGVTLTDAAGGTDTQSLSLTIAAQPAISSITLANHSGGTAGTIEQGDTVTIVFSATMKVSSFCSTWTSGDGNDQSLVANNDVTVSVSNATTDVMTVSSATCTFNLGSINLGSNAYVSSAATFKGTGASEVDDRVDREHPHARDHARREDRRDRREREHQHADLHRVRVDPGLRRSGDRQLAVHAPGGEEVLGLAVLPTLGAWRRKTGSRVDPTTGARRCRTRPPCSRRPTRRRS